MRKSVAISYESWFSLVANISRVLRLSSDESESSYGHDYCLSYIAVAAAEATGLAITWLTQIS
jgi:hypothetical protein